MAKSQYSADSARDPDVFPCPLMVSSHSRWDASLSVADDGVPGTSHLFAIASLDAPAQAFSTSITSHS